MLRRVIFIPQYPSKMRYQEWWLTEIPKQLQSQFEILTLTGAENKAETFSAEEFSPLSTAVEWELSQIKQYMALVFREDDIVLLADTSFPGLFVNVFALKKPPYLVGITHATSKNTLDLFSNVKVPKWLIEKGSALLFDKIIVGSVYHKKKLGWDNTVVLQLPIPPEYVHGKPHQSHKIKVLSVARSTAQKRNEALEQLFIDNVCDITKKEYTTWQEYYKTLAQSKYLLITSREETYGYQVVDALLHGVIPIAPRAFSYPELLPDWCLYTPGQFNALKETYDTLERESYFDRITVPGASFYINLINLLQNV